MLGRFTGRTVPRAMAALVALALSGAPRLAVAVRTGTVHVCQCRAHGDGHRCACPICAEQLRRARRGEIAKLPPCHQKKALEELAQEEERERNEGTLPTLKPTCGFDDPPGSAPAPDSFAPPSLASFSPPQRAEQLAPASDDARETPAVPDLPPPIAGR